MRAANHGDQMRHESRQQEMTSDIMTALHRSTAESGEAYIDIFRQLLINTTLALGKTNSTSWIAEEENERWGLITAPIEAFTPDERERKFLLGIILRKLASQIADRLRAWYRLSSESLPANH